VPKDGSALVSGGILAAQDGQLLELLAILNNNTTVPNYRKKFYGMQPALSVSVSVYKQHEMIQKTLPSLSTNNCRECENGCS
jgi:hypothetical protein